VVKFYDVQEDAPRPGAFIIYGDDKVGKTRLAGTFPNPVFIVPDVERGTSSLKALDKSIHWTMVTSRKEMEAACWSVRENYAQYGWQTVVVDPLTTYGRIVVSEIERDMLVNPHDVNEEIDLRRLYSQVGNHLIEIWKILQGAPLHCVWVLHATDVSRGGVISIREPDLAGRIAIDYLKKNCDLVIYVSAREVEQRGEDGTVRVVKDRRMFTGCAPNQQPRFLAGGRWEELLPEGADPGYAPHWNCLGSRLSNVISV
jgi:hypothetical protein